MVSCNPSFYEDHCYYRNRARMELLYEINRMKINQHTMYRLLKNLENMNNSSIKKLLVYILLNYKNDILTDILNQYNRSSTFLIEDENGKIDVYGIKFSKKSSPKAIL